jgi:ABC-type lipoprotein export system ATPase subunit
MLIVVTGVSVRFGPRRILDTVSMSISPGQVVALMGPSGAGKSTLLGVLSGTADVDGGTVLTVSADQVSWIVQSAPVLPRRSALDNVALGSLSRGANRSQARSDALAAMEPLGLSPLRRRPAFELSGGERQRIAVARSIAARRALILADEPTASLDPDSRTLVVRGLVEAAGRGAAVVIATHDPVVAASCHRVLAIDAGRLIDHE